ncbi:MAG: baseplate J/gp47 family protein [Chloroflexi bacterium]|nr:baseplate J/gp47 family protein [Chloroflexota bacterium]
MATKSFSDIVSSIKNYLTAVAPNIATYTGTVIGDIINAIAGEIGQNYATIDNTKTDMFLSTATGAALDSKCADLGIVRLQGARATGTVTFLRPVGASTTPAYTIPTGTQVSTLGDASNPSIYFETTTDAMLSSGSNTVDVAIQAKERSTAGNVSAATITVIPTAIAGVGSVTNAASTSGGADKETDAALRARALGSLAPLYSAAALVAAAKSVAGIFDAVVSDPADGTGSFTVYACDSSGILGAGLQSSVLTAVNARKVIGTTPTVSAPTKTVQAVTATVTVKSGYDAAIVKSNIQTAITNFINALKIGDDLIRYQMMVNVSDAVDGVDDLSISVPAGNVVTTASEVLRAGIITVS